MRLGKYRHVITLQVKGMATKHPLTGQPVATGWLDFAANIAAEVLTGAGRGEVVASQGERETIDARINFRWIPGVIAAMRVIWDGGIYAISAIEYDATGRREIRLKCTKGESNG